MSVDVVLPRRTAQKLRFGLFEADLASGELRKSGIRIRIQAQPFRVLTFLLEKPGEVVTREEIQRRLWGNDTIVDFDHSLGTAINKLREALGDSADNPRFIETLARRGYRFLAPVTPVYTEPTTPLPAISPGDTAVEEPSAPPSPEPSHLKSWLQSQTRLVPSLAGVRLALIGGAFLILAVGMFLAGWRLGSAPSIPPQIRQITFSGRVSPGDPVFESLPGTATDGARIYFPQIEKGRAMLAEALIADGETTTLDLPGEIAAPSLGDISPDGSKLLLRNHLDTNAEQALWIVSTIAGAARRIPGILAHDATWMPDGQRILYASGNNLYIASKDGTANRKLATLQGRAFWLRWSPDGSELRFTLLNTEIHSSHLWRISADGQNARPLIAASDGSECCGSWTSDGRDYVFQMNVHGDTNIWVMPERGGWFGREGNPYQLTNGPLRYEAPITSRSRRRIFFIGLDVRSELLQYDSASQLFVPFAGIMGSARRVAFSRDGGWVAWIRPEDGSLWRSRVDGSERLQLSGAPTEVFMMHWSPDNKQLVVMARDPDKPWAIYTIDAEGRWSQAIHPEDRNQADPDWSPDGRSIVFGRSPDLMAEASQPKAVYLFDRVTGQTTKLPDSDGLFSPRWSANGRYIAALSIDQMRLMLYDFTTKTWRTLVHQSVADPAWGHDDAAIYFHDFVQPDQPLYKVEIANGKIERIAGLKSLRAADAVDYRFAGLSPNDTPLVEARTSTANIYTTALPRR